MHYDYVIVGLGVSGIYTALLLNQRDPNYKILCLEGSNRTGGRVYTEHLDGNAIDMGAFRFRNDQTFVKDMASTLGLVTSPAPNIVNSCSTGVVDNIMAKCTLTNKQKKQVGFVQYVYDQGATYRDVDKYITCNGYDIYKDDVTLKLVYDLEMNPSPTFYFPEGYESICSGMLGLLGSNVTIKLNSPVTKIRKNYIKVGCEKIKHKGNKNLFVTVKPSVLPYIAHVNYNLESSFVQYCAIRAYFSLNTYVKPGIYVTGNPIRKLVVLSNSTALVYSDGPDARVVTSLITQQPSLISQWITDLIGITINLKTKDFKYKYWDDDVSFWRPRKQQSLTTCDYTYINADVSPQPGWVNGAMMLVEQTLRKH